MAGNYAELIDILDRERVLLLDMERRLEEQKHFLSTFDRMKLEDCNKGLEALSLEMSILEQSRQQAIAELAEDLGITEKQATLSALCENAPPWHVQTLRRLREALSSSTARIRDLQQRNDVLISNGLYNIRGLLEKVYDTLSPKVTYSPMRHSDDRPSSMVQGKRI